MAQCTIGSGTTITGRITGDVSVAVHGRIEGTVALDDHLMVEASGTVVADVEADDITVHGALQGSVVGRASITLCDGCSVTGDLRAPRIVIEEGARFKGNIDMDVQLPS